MFIKPLDVASLPAATYQDKAGNDHFALQSRKQNAVRSLFSGIASLSLSNSPDAAYRRSLMEYEFRIILKCPSRKTEYVVAVDETFEKIHTDWNWVEQNLFMKLTELEASKAPPTRDQLDALLVRQFDELTDEVIDPRAVEVQAKLFQVRKDLLPSFPVLADDVLLNLYACTYWITENTSARGQLCISRNYAFFQGVDSNIPTEAQAKAPKVNLLVAFRDMISIDMVNSTRVLMPDSIQIGTKQKNYVFSLYFHRKEVYRALCVLANAAMNRLIKGAENSMSALADMFGKGNVSGDLSANVGNRGAGILTMGRSRDEFSFFSGKSASLMSEGLDETDFTEQRIDRSAARDSPAVNQPDVADAEKEDALSYAELQAAQLADEQHQTALRYAHMTAATIRTIDELDRQLRNLEFRQLFRLPLSETVLLEETSCNYHHKALSANVTGKLFLSRNFFNFVALAPLPSQPNAAALSMLFDSPQDPTLFLIVPYPHIVSVKKLPPTALPSSGKITSFSLSGWLVLTTKSKQEMWMSFSNLKSRDRVSDILLQKMKQVDFHFDADFIIGERNGVSSKPAAVGPATPASSSPTTPSPMAAMFAASPGSSGHLDEYFQKVQGDPLTGGSVSGIKILKVGLKAIFDDSESEGSYPQGIRPRGGTEWNGYFETNGKDVCMIKDMKALRELIIRTGGIPYQFRGDMWMVCAGAWFSRPDHDYYEKLVRDHAEETSVFAEEIEKDVRRSLPEHPAYQSPIGIDGLRRVLTAYSWRNPAIGYAQALNIMSAVLLLHLQEEDAFWLLCIIVERILPDHYTKTLVGSVVDQNVFSKLVELHMPALWAHLSKLYMDLSTVSVPWFMCLFLNTVPLRLGVKFLDAFFVDGPKFLFWVALAILKVNEPQLISQGRDDDVFMRILKNFFQRLGLTESEEATKVEDEEAVVDPSTLSGRALFEHLLSVAYGTFSIIVTTEVLDGLRMRQRLTVVHQQEDTSRKSQIRTLCEQVSLTFDEVGVVYDEVRKYEFAREEIAEDPRGPTAQRRAEEEEEEEQMRAVLISQGGWGMSGARSSGHNPGTAKKKTRTRTQKQQEVGQKTVALSDFRKVFGVVSPWRSAQSGSGVMGSGKVNGSQRDLSRPLQRRPSATAFAKPSGGFGSTQSLNSSFGSNSSLRNSVSTVTATEDLHVGLTDRIYFYCSLHYNFLHTAKQHRAADQSSPLAPAQWLQGGDADKDAGKAAETPDRTSYIVDLATMVHILDITMKQPLHSRLRFLFDIHDLDGDGFLSKDELKAVMDSLLEMFERVRREGSMPSPDASSPGTVGSPSSVDTSEKSRENEEIYLGAVSSFLNTALKLGNSKTSEGGQPLLSSGAGQSLRRSQSSEMFRGSSTSSTAGELGTGLRILTSDGGGRRKPDGSESPGAIRSGRSSTWQSGHRRKRSSSFSTPIEPVSASPLGGGLDGETGGSGPNLTAGGDAAVTDTSQPFRLSFNEFLLAVLSQSVFVQYFERIWTLSRLAATDTGPGKVAMEWREVAKK
ncbi:rab-GTPase-TBC domain-containing protein [Fimicolochytrium jonesii]|uniref:rab-GTPase-TBC domain-containing protein n=1 Tax=Fimicolochytrium jonesii TaxID=1396493 RepID=UPI0022FF2585|nr:rab-GTPase-TBC domain-containing protein [Fimicolochytrium jonesii]KAI8822174.1 rab-GTPase-TBC domain-containing protein [Fimicolochytrium jonesii]